MTSVYITYEYHEITHSYAHFDTTLEKATSI